MSVVIPAYSLERLDDIRRAVESARGQTRKPSEIIVAVDHSEELMDRLMPLSGDGVRVVLNTGARGSAETRNVGIRSATGDIVAFIDDDAVADKHWIETLVRHYSKPNVMAVGGNIISVWRDGRPFWFPEELDWAVGGVYKGHPERLCEVRNLIWPNMSFRRGVCDQIGYVRTDIGALGNRSRAGDETEFCMRMKSLIPRGKIIYEPRAVVCHKVKDASFGHLIARSFSDGKHKGESRRAFSRVSDRPLSTEGRYARYLLACAIPRKVASGKLPQAFAMAISLLAAGAGYMKGLAWQAYRRG